MHTGENGLGFVDVNRENELEIDGNAYKNDEVSFVANAQNKVPTTIFAWAINFVDYHECRPVFFLHAFDQPFSYELYWQIISSEAEIWCEYCC